MLEEVRARVVDVGLSGTRRAWVRVARKRRRTGRRGGEVAFILDSQLKG